MKRRLFNALTAMSLLACIAAIALWHRSYGKYDQFFEGGTKSNHRLGLVAGNWIGVTSLSWNYARFDKDGDAEVFAADFLARSKQPPPPEGFRYASRPIVLNVNVGWPFDQTLLNRRGFVFYQDGPHKVTVNPNTNESATASYSYSLIAVPHWFIVVLTGPLPVIVFCRYIRRRRRRAMGCCQTCGYDLRATPDCCPECGAIPAKKEMVSSRTSG